VKKHIPLIIGLVALALLGTTAANAQGGFTATPAQLTIAGPRGAVETRTLLLSATDPITDLRVIPLDLLRADNRAVLPASAVRLALPVTEIAAGGLLTVPVTIDLHSAASGEFTGEILFSYHGGSLTVPATVTIKDPPVLPLLILLVGVGLGVIVSAYRASGRPRDEILTRVAQLRAQMRADAELAGPFKERIEAILVDVEEALQAEKWQDGQTAVEQAEAVWARWRKGRADWLTQLAHQETLLQRLADEGEIPYVQALRRGLEDVAHNAPDAEGPDKLREQLDGLGQQINSYIRLRAGLDQLNFMREKLPADPGDAWRIRALNLENRLAALSPNDTTEAAQSLQNDVDTALAEIAPLCAGAEMCVKGVREAEATPLQLLGAAPSARPLPEDGRPSGARVRLRLFTWASYGIAVLLLAGAGFGELYIANATFGASVWGDYFALLAWGFGAEATRASITQMVQGWGLPGV